MAESSNNTDSIMVETAVPSPMSATTRFAFGFYMMALNVVLVYLLIKIWPEKTSQTVTETIDLFWNQLRIAPTLEVRYFLIVVLAGGLGSYIHTATSFADFVGNRRCYASWSWWYLLRPFIGIALSLMMYFAVRGGLVGSSAGADSLSPHGIAAIAGLAGLFSKQATDKLREVFETLFKTDEPPNRDDRLNTTS
ncbi:MAG TPA: hypothetical protein VG649_15310 [Candidatus Angelobacter sp.]|jgi:hypothetical protein|nr:hypothetical protein [Candidatus Angelobacter sp.]